MKLYLVRDCETDYNAKKIIISTTDLPLNKNGVKQASFLRKQLINEKFDFIISSPLLRAKQTAEIINENLGLEIQFDNRIRERDYGEFEGINIDNFDFVSFWEYNNKKIGKTETSENFINRVFSFLNELKNKYEDKNILIVAHGSINIAISAYFAKEIPTNLLDVASIIESMEVNEYEY
ncbi:MAG: histidine phosphatase family protein [Bacilli bacterium]|nr:histidine phosphatase family protein [Bacilli bacterium]